MAAEPRPIVLRCEFCDGEFRAARSHARFCSGRCRVAAHRERKRAEEIPSELRERDRWVLWERGSKVPYQVGCSRKASSTAADTWGPYEDAVAAGRRRGMGVGFVLDGDGVVCLDLDHCLVDGELVPWARRLLDGVGETFVEVSPSGEGLHVWGFGEVDGGRVVDGVEVYGSGRYVTVTGDRFGGAPCRLADLSGVLEGLVG